MTAIALPKDPFRPIDLRQLKALYVLFRYVILNVAYDFFVIVICNLLFDACVLNLG